MIVRTQFEHAGNWRDADQAHKSPRAASWHECDGSVSPSATCCQATVYAFTTTCDFIAPHTSPAQPLRDLICERFSADAPADLATIDHRGEVVVLQRPTLLQDQQQPSQQAGE